LTGGMDTGGEPSLEAMVIQYLLAHTQCSKCGRHYEREDVQIRDRRGDIWLAFLTCGHCGLRNLVMATFRTRGLSRDATETAADPDEVVEFERFGPIAAEDVLDLHCFLRDFDGDLRQLLGE
jgi:hypothetical protein